MRILKQVFLITVIYAIVGRLALFLALPPGYATPIWPAAGIALAFLLMYGYRVWPGVLLGSFLVNIWTSIDVNNPQMIPQSILLALCIGTGAAAQAAFGCFLLKRIFPQQFKLTMVREISLFFIYGSLLSCMVSPAIGVISLILSGSIAVDGSLISWLAWWTGDALGVFIFAPLTLAWIPSSGDVWKSCRVMLTVPLSIILVCIIIVFHFGHKAQENQLSLLLHNKSLAFKAELEQKFDEIYLILNSMQGFYKSSVYVDRQEFSSFVSNFIEYIPEIKSIAWVPRVTHEERNKYIDMAVKDGLTGFQIKEIDNDGNITPANDHEEYYPVFYIEPRGNHAVLGINNGSEFARNQVIQEAVDTGQIRASKPLVLIQDKALQVKSVLFITPIYKNVIPENMNVSKREILAGFVTITARISSLIEWAWNNVPLNNIRFFINDVTDGSENIYETPVNRQVVDTITSSIDLNVMGRKWQLTFQPSLDFYFAHQTWGLWWIIVGAFLCSGLLNVIFLVNSGQTFEIGRIIDMRTEQLRESKEYLEREIKEREKIVQKMLKQSDRMQQQRGAMLNILEDVEIERRESEKARQEAVELADKVTNIIKTANEAFISIDGKGKILEWNPKAQEIFGWSKEEVLGQFLHESIIPPAHRGAHQQGIQHFLKTGDGPVLGKLLELTALRKDGQEIPVELTISNQKIRNGHIFNAFLRDISERKSAEKQLQESAQELERSNKELEQFAYVASHDLQEPIRKIVGFTQLFENSLEGKIEGKSREYMDFVIDGAKRMQTLIQDLLQYSRAGTRELDYTETNFNEVAEEALSNLELVIKESKAEITCENLPAALKAHRNFMVRLFQNLIGNALKYRSEETAPVIKVSALQKDEFWEFTIEDNGIGIDQEYAERIFVIFQRLHGKTEYSGTGIGLAVCKRMVERHGGKIWLEPKSTKGSMFKFTLPV